MVYGINGLNGVNNDINIKLNKVSETSTMAKSTFGDGFATGNDVGLDRVIPGLDALIAKFDFEPPAYTKNIPQLTIDDRYYIPDQPFVEQELCEV